MPEPVTLTCRCGALHLQVRPPHIASVECCCDSCREAARRLARLPGSPQVAAATGGTRYVMARKDRVSFVRGAENLRFFRLAPGRKTRRYLAGCCDTPLFAELENGHWLSLYGALFPPAALPPLRERTMTRDMANPAALPGDAHNAKTHSFGFVFRLLGAWIAMELRAPALPAAAETTLS